MLNAELVSAELERRARAWADGFRQAAAGRVREAAGELLARVLAEHPVASGKSRAGWYPAAEALGVSFTPLGEEQAVARGRSQGTAGLELGAEDPAAVIVNGVEHALYLEDGAAGRAPHAMVRANVEARRGALAVLLRADLIRVAAKDTP